VSGYREGPHRGFSLLEVLFALAVLSVALAGLAQLFTIAARANASARATTYAVVLAQEKMEQLRGLAFGFDTSGNAVTDLDTDITVQPESPGVGTGLRPSPPGALGENTVGYVDYVDANGASLGGAMAVPPPGAAYIRRWSVEPLPSGTGTIVLQVLVTPARHRGEADARSRLGRLPDEARMISVKTRKAP
jgi:prepilin-type N-terminal cleavage/methylation domain-containing protein